MDQKVVAVRVLAALALVALAACTTTPSTPSAAPTADAVIRGGILRVALAADIASLDPWTVDGDSDVVLRQVFEPLVDLEPGGYAVVPRLAERWSPSPDGLTWTFRLRDGVRFHDGTALDAVAVVANFERARALVRPDLATLLAEVAAADARTVVFTLRSPYAPFPATLASPSFGMVSPACMREDRDWATPQTRCAAGTGPFRIEPGGWRAGERLMLQRDPAYWGRDAAGRSLPYLDGITFQPIADPAARVAALRSAAVDIALDVGVAGARVVRSDPKVTQMRRPPFGTSFIGIGPSVLLAAVEVRRAMAMAIDRSAIAQTAYGGDARAATQLVPPAILGHDETIVQFAPNDVPAAKRLLADARIAPSAGIDLWYPSEPVAALPDPRRVAEAISADLARIGLAATPRAEAASTLEARARAGVLPLWIGARSPARADPDDFLRDVSFDPVVGELLRRAAAEPDRAKRADLYKQITKMVQQDVMRIPLFHAGVSHGVSRKIHGFVPQPVGGESLAVVWIGR